MLSDSSSLQNQPKSRLSIQYAHHKCRKKKVLEGRRRVAGRVEPTLERNAVRFLSSLHKNLGPEVVNLELRRVGPKSPVTCRAPISDRSRKGVCAVVGGSHCSRHEHRSGPNSGIFLFLHRSGCVSRRILSLNRLYLAVPGLCHY